MPSGIRFSFAEICLVLEFLRLVGFWVVLVFEVVAKFGGAKQKGKKTDTGAGYLLLVLETFV